MATPDPYRPHGPTMTLLRRELEAALKALASRPPNPTVNYSGGSSDFAEFAANRIRTALSYIDVPVNEAPVEHVPEKEGVA